MPAKPKFFNCKVRRIEARVVPEGQINPFEWNILFEPLKYHITSSYGVDRGIETAINIEIRDALLERNFNGLKEILVQYKHSFPKIVIDDVINYIYLKAISESMNKEDFTLLLEHIPINTKKKIDYYVNIARRDEPPSEFYRPITYSETLKDLTIRFGLRELTNILMDEPKKTSRDENDLVEAPAAKRR